MVEKSVELTLSEEIITVETVRLEPNIVEKRVENTFNEETLIVDTSSLLLSNESALIGVAVFRVYTLMVDTSIWLPIIEENIVESTFREEIFTLETSI